MTPLELRNEITTLLTGLIGTYTLPGGSSTPAIAIQDGGIEYPPGGTSITGLEVVITPSLEIPVRPLQGGYQQTVSTLITLKQWDVDKTTLEAMDAIVGGFISDTVAIASIVRQMRSSQLDTIEQCRIVVQEAYWIQVG